MDEKELAALIQAWLASRRSENTRAAYRGALESFTASGRDLLTATSLNMVTYMQELKKEGLKEATINLRMAAISSFYGFGIRHGALTYNPADVERIKISPYGKSTWLDDTQARALLSKINRSTPQGTRDYALFYGYLMTGLRNTPWREARWEDFENQGGKIYMRWSCKGKSDQKAPIAPPLWDCLLLLATITERNQGFVFSGFHQTDYAEQALAGSSVNKLLKVYARKAGLDPMKVHVHTLRHAAAMLRLKAGDDVLQISKFLGHSNIAITQIYLDHLNNNVQDSWQMVSDFLGHRKGK